MGFTFDDLCELGTGEHDLKARDPYDFSNTGKKPEYESEWASGFARFESVLFGYQVGVYTAREVLAIAADVVALGNKSGA